MPQLLLLEGTVDASRSLTLSIPKSQTERIKPGSLRLQKCILPSSVLLSHVTGPIILDMEYASTSVISNTQVTNGTFLCLAVSATPAQTDYTCEYVVPIPRALTERNSDVSLTLHHSLSKVTEKVLPSLHYFEQVKLWNGEQSRVFSKNESVPYGRYTRGEFTFQPSAHEWDDECEILSMSLAEDGENASTDVWSRKFVTLSYTKAEELAVVAGTENMVQFTLSPFKCSCAQDLSNEKCTLRLTTSTIPTGRYDARPLQGAATSRLQDAIQSLIASNWQFPAGVTSFPNAYDPDHSNSETNANIHYLDADVRNIFSLTATVRESATGKLYLQTPLSRCRKCMTYGNWRIHSVEGLLPRSLGLLHPTHKSTANQAMATPHWTSAVYSTHIYGIQKAAREITCVLEAPFVLSEYFSLTATHFRYRQKTFTHNMQLCVKTGVYGDVTWGSAPIVPHHTVFTSTPQIVGTSLDTQVVTTVAPRTDDVATLPFALVNPIRQNAQVQLRHPLQTEQLDVVRYQRQLEQTDLVLGQLANLANETSRVKSEIQAFEVALQTQWDPTTAQALEEARSALKTLESDPVLRTDTTHHEQTRKTVAAKLEEAKRQVYKMQNQPFTFVVGWSRPVYASVLSIVVSETGGSLSGSVEVFDVSDLNTHQQVLDYKERFHTYVVPLASALGPFDRNQWNTAMLAVRQKRPSNKLYEVPTMLDECILLPAHMTSIRSVYSLLSQPAYNHSDAGIATVHANSIVMGDSYTVTVTGSGVTAEYTVSVHATHQVVVKKAIQDGKVYVSWHNTNPSSGFVQNQNVYVISAYTDATQSFTMKLWSGSPISTAWAVRQGSGSTLAAPAVTYRQEWAFFTKEAPIHSELWTDRNVLFRFHHMGSATSLSLLQEQVERDARGAPVLASTPIPPAFQNVHSISLAQPVSTAALAVRIRSLQSADFEIVEAYTDAGGPSHTVTTGDAFLAGTSECTLMQMYYGMAANTVLQLARGVVEVQLDTQTPATFPLLSSVIPFASSFLWYPSQSGAYRLVPHANLVHPEQKPESKIQVGLVCLPGNL